MSADFELSDDENGTCTIAVLHGFEGKGCYDVFGEAHAIGQDNPVTLDEFKERCRYIVDCYNETQEYDCTDWDGNVADGVVYLEHMAIVTATTSSLQTHAEENLKALGFQQNGPYHSDKYNGVSLISLWIMPVKDFIKAIEK